MGHKKRKPKVGDVIKRAGYDHVWGYCMDKLMSAAGFHDRIPRALKKKLKKNNKTIEFRIDAIASRPSFGSIHSLKIVIPE